MIFHVVIAELDPAIHRKRRLAHSRRHLISKRRVG